MKYVPKTTAKMREKAVGYGYGYSKDTAVAILTDLTSCESCLAEAERKVERLRNVIRKLVSEWVPTDVIDDAQQLINSEGRAGA